MVSRFLQYGIALITLNLAPAQRSVHPRRRAYIPNHELRHQRRADIRPDFCRKKHAHSIG
jgi:hypothetical protein